MIDFASEGYVLVREHSTPQELRLLRQLYADAFDSSHDDEVMTESNQEGELIMRRLLLRGPDSAPIERTQFFDRGRALAAACLKTSLDELTVMVVLIEKPSLGPTTQWHQHTANPRPPFIATDVTLWMPLEDVTSDNSALQVIPGSHLGPRVPHDARLCADEAFIDRGFVVTCAMKAGDAILIHENLLHAATRNSSRLARTAISLYCHTQR